MVTSTPLSSLSEFREYLESRKHILLPPGDAMLAGDSFIFLIEDLSPNLIELVGSYLSIAPEVFLHYTKRVAWERAAVPPAQDVENRTPPKREPELDCFVFRPYKAITELAVSGKYPAYICAVQERATSYMSGQHCETIDANDGLRIALPELLARARIRLLTHTLDWWGCILWKMGRALDGIDASLSDHFVVSRRLPEWRRLWCNWRGLLADLESTAQRTTSLIDTLAIGPESGYDELRQLKIGLAACEKDRKRLERRVESSFQALMSTMSIIESRNAVSQGESISKLTELAFIFIPLSFATSFFGMEIKEWEATKPQLWQFWTVSCGLLLVAYLIRLTIRSTRFQDPLGRLKLRVAQASAIPEGTNIPSRAWFKYVSKSAFRTIGTASSLQARGYKC
ncbi:hypothetical protein BZA05DRAFT_438756 [Tricharina praecox]|uniref:uncharacterized protein n=1 Tax=Tricharina praecox TaxID=43433 RepID=UPI00221FE63D|nr:uncharacterized protein BZA05DRAFT_438756 [Tricharina praecox]KAI5844931.1 hypothetical protein BZA05DRAFT_438756 [Tricharina praecox]